MNLQGVDSVMPIFQNVEVLNGADLNLPDGMSVVRAMRSLGVDQRDRVYGPDLTLEIAQRAAEAGVPVAFYGSSQTVLDALATDMPAGWRCTMADAVAEPGANV